MPNIELGHYRPVSSSLEELFESPPPATSGIPGYISEDEFARLVNRQPSTLRRWRKQHFGPTAVRIGPDFTTARLPRRIFSTRRWPRPRPNGHHRAAAGRARGGRCRGLSDDEQPRRGARSAGLMILLATVASPVMSRAETCATGQRRAGRLWPRFLGRSISSRLPSGVARHGSRRRLASHP